MARAIAQEARLLLLDEPFTGVDATSEELLMLTPELLQATYGARAVESWARR